MKRVITCSQIDWSDTKSSIDVSDDSMTEFVQEALEPLGWVSEPSIQGTSGADFVYDADMNTVAVIPYSQELDDFQTMLDASTSREDFISAIKTWYMSKANY